MSQLRTALTLLFSCCLSLSASAADLQLRSVPVASSTMQFNIQTPERCMFGDFNALLQDMSHAKNANLQFVLKGIGDNEISQLFLDEVTHAHLNLNFKELQRKLIEGSYPVTVTLPKVSKKVLGAVTICKNSNGSGCNNAKVTDINQILKGYQKPRANYESEDHAYFLQPVIYDSTSMYFFSETINANNKDKAAALLRDLFPDKGSVIKGLVEDSTVLASLPFVDNSGVLTVQLPIYSKSKCEMAR